MKRLTTESGAVYLWDEIGRRFKREGPHSPGIRHADGEWYYAHAPHQPEVGYPMIWFYDPVLPDGADMRRTTPLVSVEEEPWPGGG